MFIPVIFSDDSTQLVKPDELDELIHSREIISFRRSDGWVQIGVDPVRIKKNQYTGPERSVAEIYGFPRRSL
jgi:hypothetical protein